MCHLSWFQKLSPAHTHPLISIHEFSKPCKLLFFELESLIKMLNVNWEKIHSIILSLTCHGFQKLSPTQYTSPHIHSWIFKTLQVIIFWVRVTHKMLNVNWEKIHSIILSLTCHGFRNFPLLIHIPSQPFMNFSKPYELLFSELVTHKMLNVNWEKIHSIILSLTCHGLRNFPLLIHIPSKPFVNFWNPMSYYFLS